ncbi:MAG: hypothetical protein H0V28_13190 [Rubrobacteraceae bacterium]|jgi:hypothetical protein|nr:hypothetical protein [Rubrobacteraceae bacterium]
MDTTKDSATRAVPVRAQEALLAAAEEALDMLDSRRAHHPPEMIDPREGRVAKALRAAVRAARPS